MTPSESTPVPEKILIIDDEQGLRNMLKFGLKKRGYEVFDVEGGEQALVLAKTHSFALAVCDIMMPGMDGVQVLKGLKEISPTTEVIMATGYATLETAVESMKLGAFDYITKPYSLGNLCTIFEKANEHRKLKAKVNYLQELDRLKDEFIHTMNHELRTPLASVMGYISLTRQGIYGPITEQQRDVMTRAEVNSKYLLQLINGILDFSKLQANRMTLNPEVFPLEDVMRDVSSVMEPLAVAKNITLSIDRHQNVSVFCDRMRLQQILLNLAGNAVKFTNAGSVKLQVTLNDDESVSFRISDTGVGIAADKLPLLFQEFQQIDGSDTRAHRGTGLGLAISKRLAEKMGGNILVQSKPGTGSVFVVNLPILKDASALPPAKELSVLEPTTERIILAIDDDADMLKLLADGVNGAGFRVVTAQSGPEGIALARRLRPDCITLDLLMPHMDGWQVLHTLKNDPALKDIPVYILSMVEEQARAFAMGVAGYLQKPLKRDELIAQLALVQRKTQQIMVVDDDPAIRDVLTAALCADGYDVVPVTNGEEALSRLKTLSPDVLFLDLVLSGGTSGFDILAALDEQPNRDKISVFIMTGKDLTEDEQKYLNRRSHMVIQKGTQTIPQLVQALKKKVPSLKEAA